MKTHTIRDEGCGCCSVTSRVKELGSRLPLQTGQVAILVQEVSHHDSTETIGKPFWTFEDDLSNDYYGDDSE